MNAGQIWPSLSALAVLKERQLIQPWFHHGFDEGQNKHEEQHDKKAGNDFASLIKPTGFLVNFGVIIDEA